MRDMARVQAFPFGKGPARAASDLLNDGAEVISNDHLSEFLVRQVKRFQEIIVEEVAEGPWPMSCSRAVTRRSSST